MAGFGVGVAPRPMERSSKNLRRPSSGGAAPPTKRRHELNGGRGPQRAAYPRADIEHGLHPRATAADPQVSRRTRQGRCGPPWPSRPAQSCHGATAACDQGMSGGPWLRARGRGIRGATMSTRPPAADWATDFDHLD